MSDVTAQPHEPLSVEEFLDWELRQETKHEYADGRVFGFAGGTLGHTGLAAALVARILPSARPCRTFGSDALIEMLHSVRYADVVVTCDERDADPTRRSVCHPKLIIEVLSESTAHVDLTTKRDEYLEIDTLEEYVTIDSRRRWAQALRRVGTDWILSLPITSGSLSLHSIGLTLDVDELYPAAGI